MNLTRNTKMYKSSNSEGNVDVMCRSLTLLELNVIGKMTSHFHKCEFAFQLAYISGTKPNFFAQQQIGNDVIVDSNIEFNNMELFELTVEEMRHAVKDDNTLNLIHHISNSFPGTSLEYLLNLTFLDLIELGALCENITNKKIFTTTNSSANNIKINEGTKTFEEDGKSLQEKMKDLAKF